VLRRAIVEAKRVLGLHSPGRNLAVFPDDTFLVSFPKSGNTWARFLIANLVRPNEKIDFSNVNRVIPGPEVTSNRDLMRVPRPRIVKSHQYFDPRYKQVIYIARDPRDVVVSQYYFQRKRKLLAMGSRLQNLSANSSRAKLVITDHGESMSAAGSLRAMGSRDSCCCGTKIWSRIRRAN